MRLIYKKKKKKKTFRRKYFKKERKKKKKKTPANDFTLLNTALITAIFAALFLSP